MATNYYDSLYSTPSYTSYATTSGLEDAGIWILISAILAVIGGILVYALFLNKKNENKLKGFNKWLYAFLKFDKLTIEVVLKVTYIIAAIFITLAAFSYLGSAAWWLFFIQIIFGNIGLRLGYELILITILLWRNTEDIKKAIKK
jgi:hypothetical protein